MIAKLALFILVSVALIGAVYGAAAGLTVGGVDELGSGTADVNPPCGDGVGPPCTAAADVVVTDVEWFLNLGNACGDSSQVSHVRVTVDTVSPTTNFDIIRFQISGLGGVLAHSGTAFDGSQLDGLAVGFFWDLSAGTTF